MAVIGLNFNVFSYDAVLVENRTPHLPDAERMRYVLCYYYEAMLSYWSYARQFEYSSIPIYRGYRSGTAPATRTCGGPMS